MLVKICLNTRMHSSRVRTVHFNGHGRGGCLSLGQGEGICFLVWGVSASGCEGYMPLHLAGCTTSRDTPHGQTLPCADPLSWADTPWADTLGTHSSPHPLWTEFLAYAFENITFPQLLLRAIKNLRVEFIICELLEKYPSTMCHFTIGNVFMNTYLLDLFLTGVSIYQTVHQPIIWVSSVALHHSRFLRHFYWSCRDKHSINSLPFSEPFSGGYTTV